MPSATSWFNSKMSNEDAARFQYRLRPYLSGAPRPALDARLSDIAVNLFDFTSDGCIGLWDNPFRDHWLDLLIAVNVELVRRNEQKLKLPQLEEWVFTDNAVRSFREQSHVFRAPSPTGIFCKYGEERWMREFSLQPARGQARLPSLSDAELLYGSHVRRDGGTNTLMISEHAAPGYSDVQGDLPRLPSPCRMKMARSISISRPRNCFNLSSLQPVYPQMTVRPSREPSLPGAQ
jgi:hypothetical protein